MKKEQNNTGCALERVVLASSTETRACKEKWKEAFEAVKAQFELTDLLPD